MIFDSEEIQVLREKYRGVSNIRLPSILQIDQSNDFEDERLELEKLIRQIPEEKRMGLKKRLISTDEGQHLSAWFELKLLGWLNGVGEVTFEPEIEGNIPDYLLISDGQQIVLEAIAVLRSEESRRQRLIDSEIHSFLGEINKPYMITIEGVSAKEIQNKEDFKNTVTMWLENEPSEKLNYGNDSIGHIVLKAKYFESLNNVRAMGPARAEFISPSAFIGPLKKKSKQHKAIRDMGIPYVIVILIDSFMLSAEEVVNAWFGKHQVVVDINSNTVTDEKFDGTGLHFYKSQVLRKSVSGTLVIKRLFMGTKYQLNAWWIQNPYAKVPISPSTFPVVRKWIIKKKNDLGTQMGWE